jgi:hypothetical protein
MSNPLCIYCKLEVYREYGYWNDDRELPQFCPDNPTAIDIDVSYQEIRDFGGTNYPHIVDALIQLAIDELENPTIFADAPDNVVTGL